MGTNLAVEGIDIPPPLDDDILLLGEVYGHLDGVRALRGRSR